MNKIYIGSSDNMDKIEDGSVDLIVTSPPYFNIKDYSKNGTQDESHSTKKDKEIGGSDDFKKYLDMLLGVWKECHRVLRPNGKLIINVPLLPMIKKDYSTHKNRHIFDLQSEIQSSILKGTDLFLMDLYIWNRTNSSKKLMFGSYPHPPNFYAQNTIEFVTVYVKDGPSKKIPADIKAKSKLTQEEWVSLTKQIWNIPSPNRGDIAFGKHSAIMPEQIVERCVRLYSCYGDIVLDPFTGSGTTLKVAKSWGRNYLGYELYDNYKELIEEKIAAVKFGENCE